ncbi:MAG: hypothetical protein ACYCQI_11315 [Gammaproteobacteria bacterium]
MFASISRKSERIPSTAKITRQLPQQFFAGRPRAKVLRTVILPDNVTVTLEDPGVVLLAGSNMQAIFFHHNNSLQRHLFISMSKVDEICALPESQQVLTLDKRRVLKLWNVFTGKIECQLQLTAANFDKDIKITALNKGYFVISYSCGDETHVELRETEKLSCIANEMITDNSINSCFYAEDQLFLGKAHGFERWQISNRQFKKIEEVTFEDDTYFGCLGLLMDGCTLVTGHRGGKLQFWSLGDKTTLLSQFPGNGFDINNLMVLPDWVHLVTWHDHSATLWNIADINHPKIINQISSHDSLGRGKSYLTQDWRIITDTNQIIDFHEVRQLYQNQIIDLLDGNKIRQDVANIVLDYSFVRP